MSVQLHAFLQVLALVMQGLNYLSPLTPSVAKPWVAFVLLIGQAIMGLANHFYNPDGTPASVAYKAQ